MLFLNSVIAFTVCRSLKSEYDMHVRAMRGVIQDLPAFIRTMSILPNISKFTHFFVSDVIETDFSTSSNHNVSMQPRLHRLVPQHVPLCGRVRVDRRSGISHKASETVLTTSETALTSGQDDFVVPKTRVIRTFCVSLHRIFYIITYKSWK